MTQKQFLAELPKLRKMNPYLSFGRIRLCGPSARQSECPLSALAVERGAGPGGANWPLTSAKELGVSEKIAHKIIAAADGSRTAHPKLRAAMLDALGLKEES